MTTLIYTNGAGTIRVEYVTDLLPGNTGKFTVMEIKGMNDAAEIEGLDFKALDFDLATFEAFASANSLKLERVTQDSSETVVDATGSSSS